MIPSPVSAITRFLRHGLAALAVQTLGTMMAFAAAAEQPKPSFYLLVGAPGEEEFRTKFNTWAERWTNAATLGGARVKVIGTDPLTAPNSLDDFREALAKEEKDGFADLWIVLIGHGTFDGKEAKFNLTGGDLSASELATLLQPIQRRMAVINCSSASAPFIQALSGPHRVILTATKSGAEHNFARYGEYLSAAIGDPESDLDKDGQVSLLEAHLMGSKRTAEVYVTEGKLASEHSLIDDNGDKLGTPADWFRGIRAIKKAKDGSEADGLRAHQLCLIPNASERTLPLEVRQKRDALELELARLRDKKASMEEKEYYDELEGLLRQLALLYKSASPAGTAPVAPSAK